MHPLERVWQTSTAKHGALLVHLALARYVDDRGVSGPGLGTLERETRLTRRAVQDGLRKLEELAEIVPLAVSHTVYGTKQWDLSPAGAESGQAPEDSAPLYVDPSTTSLGQEKKRADLAPPAPKSSAEALAAELPETRDLVDNVRAEMVGACAVHGCALPSREAITTTLRDYPDRNPIVVARDLSHWAVHGNGTGRKIKQMAGTYRNFMRLATPAPASAATETPEEARARRSQYDRIANE